MTLSEDTILENRYRIDRLLAHGGMGAIYTDDPAEDKAPVWSSDSLKLAFASERDGNWEIYAINSDGSGQSNLTNNRADDVSPASSP